MRFFLALLLLPNILFADPINPVNDVNPRGILCAGGKYAPLGADCPPGQELQDPVLAFTDLISGPDTGLGDGNGSGVIVTVWGQNLGSSQGSSTIQYCDSLSVCRNGYVYYWKNADGTLPSGPANLYESHKMQEIAFSIPDSALGNGRIKVVVDGQEAVAAGTASGDIPFTVRAGNIYHVKSNGNDTTGDGSFNNPWLTVAKADEAASTPAGSTIYIHDIITGAPDQTDQYGIYSNGNGGKSTLDAQYSYVTYPNKTHAIVAMRGVNSYAGSDVDVVGTVTSKQTIYAASSDVDENDLPINERDAGTYGIFGTKDGRAVANYITDSYPGDANGGCPDGQNAAIVANALGTNNVENFKVLGNMIENYGCSGTNRQHHVTYLSNRSGAENLEIQAPEMAWNYLKNNYASDGLHYFDEYAGGDECGDWTTTFKVHNNVVINQVGAGISNYSKCPTNLANFEYYNNIVINSGVYPPNNALITPSDQISRFQAVFIGQSDGVEASTATLNFYNNTIIKWNDSDVTGTVDACIGFINNGGEDPATLTITWDDNICMTDKDKRFIQSNSAGPQLESRISGGGNVWYTSASSPTLAVPPAWDATKITTDPLLTITGSQVSVGSSSPIINQSNTTLDYDVYGKIRSTSSNVGAVQ